MQQEQKTQKIKALCVSHQQGMRKTPVPQAIFIEDKGIKDDIHAGLAPLRQVSLLASESVDKMRPKLPTLADGDFAENILVEGIELKTLPLGTLIKIGDEVVLRVTQIGKSCHTGCNIMQTVGFCIMPVEGIFASVLKGGVAYVNDPIILEQ
ncbi:MAG: MOSC domain-containing protein [Desulfovibrionaceae bacterium]